MPGRTLPVGCYGKLPLSKEFLRWRCHAGPALRLHDAMNRAFEDPGGAPPSFGAASRLLFRARGASGGVLAVLRDSTDEGGLRAFPFALFVEVSTEDLRRTRGILGRFGRGNARRRRMTDLRPLWAGLESRLGEAAGAGGRSAFLEWVGSLELSWDPEAEADGAAPGAIDGAAWNEACWGPGAPEDAWARAFHALAVESRSARTTRFRIPVGTGLDPDAQLEAWVLLYEAVASRVRDLPATFLPAEGVDTIPAGVLEFGADGLEDLRAVVPGPSRGVADLGDAGRAEPRPGFDAFRTRLGPRADGASLEDLLRSVGEGGP